MYRRMEVRVTICKTGYPWRSSSIRQSSKQKQLDKFAPRCFQRFIRINTRFQNNLKQIVEKRFSKPFHFAFSCFKMNFSTYIICSSNYEHACKNLIKSDSTSVLTLRMY